MIERIIGKIFGDYQLLLFQSEFEVTEECSSLEQGFVKPLDSKEQVMEELAKEIEKSYADHPIIVFCDKEA